MDAYIISHNSDKFMKKFLFQRSHCISVHFQNCHWCCYFSIGTWIVMGAYSLGL